MSAEPPAKRRPTEKHPKEALQDALNAIQMPPAEYVLAPCTEPGRMAVECRIRGDVASTGTGCDFKEASAQSALNVLTQLRAMQAARAGTSAGPQPRPPLGLNDEAAATSTAASDAGKHPKALLNEFIHAYRKRYGALDFPLLEDRGPRAPDPNGRFVVAARVGERTISTARGKTLKAASTTAAEQALQVLRAEVGGACGRGGGGSTSTACI